MSTWHTIYYANSQTAVELKISLKPAYIVYNFLHEAKKDTHSVLHMKDNSKTNDPTTVKTLSRGVIGSIIYPC